MSNHTTHWSTDGAGRNVNFSLAALTPGAKGVPCAECQAEVRRTGAANRAAPLTPRDQEWLDYVASEIRADINADYARAASSPARITRVELVMRRERLGLSQTELARLVGVEDRAVRRWESGDRDMLGKHEDLLGGIESEFEQLVDDAVEALERLEPRDRTLVTYRTEAALRKLHPDAQWPASMQRAIAWAVASRVDSVQVFFTPDYTGKEPRLGEIMNARINREIMNARINRHRKDRKLVTVRGENVAAVLLRARRNGLALSTEGYTHEESTSVYHLASFMAQDAINALIEAGYEITDYR